MFEHPSPAEAAGLVASASQLQATVRSVAAWRHVAWLTGMTVASTMYLAALGVTGESDAEVLLVSLPFVVCVGVLCVALLPGSQVMSAGMERRWSSTLLTWGVLFGLALGLGLAFFRGVPAFWLVVAAVVAVPLVLGARAEARAAAGR